MEWLVPIAVAVIGGPLVALIQMLRKENTNQHAESRGLLEYMVEKIDKINDKFDTHMEEKHGKD